jgi:hypothetical protein
MEKLQQRFSALEARMDPFRTANIGEASPQTDKACSSLAHYVTKAASLREGGSL